MLRRQLTVASSYGIVWGRENLPLVLSVPYDEIEITREAIEAALAGLVYGASRGSANPLEHLLLVEQQLTGPWVPRSPFLRRQTLNGLLVDLLVEHVEMLWTANGLGIVNPDATRPELLGKVQQAGQTRVEALIGWTWLYCRYIRDDLHIAQSEFAATALVVDRTLRRYADYALDQLTQVLVEREWQVRREQKHLWLNQRLPMVVPVKLVGREEDEHLLRTVLTQVQPQHVQVIGLPGTGKTAFVQEAVRSAIRQDEFDQVIWLDRPQSVQAVRQALEQALRTEGMSIGEYVTRFRTSVVFDDIQALEDDVNVLQALLVELGAATVYAINETYLPLEHAPARVILRDLDYRAAVELIDRLLKLVYPEEAFTKDEIDVVWERVGGNPSAIKRLVQRFHQVFT